MLNRLSWCAGVLEARAMFRLRTKKDGSVIGADVLCYCPQDIAKVLMKALGGVYSTSKGMWYLRSQDQRAGLEVLLPYVQSKKAKTRITRVMLFRATQVSGGTVSPEVSEFRKGLSERKEGESGESSQKSEG